MLLIMGSLIIGMIIGFSGLIHKEIIPYLSKVTTIALFIMLAILGAQIGCNNELLHNLTLLGGRALLIAFLSIVGSVAAVWLVMRLFLSNSKGEQA